MREKFKEKRVENVDNQRQTDKNIFSHLYSMHMIIWEIKNDKLGSNSLNF